MPLISVRDLSIGYFGPSLFEAVSCEISEGDRIGLLGRNGAGKSTFLKILAGSIEPDSGEVVLAPATRIALLDQNVPTDIAGTISRVVIKGLADQESPTDEWKQKHEVEQILSRMGLDGEIKFETLSSGMKRRVLLAQALVSKPEVLLLDEPTNHLDIEAIGWLEQFLERFVKTFIFVTHDRMFLQKMANRILEIDRGRLFDWSCDYPTFLSRKEQALATEEKENALFDKRLAEEEAWIRKGIKARRTRNEGRVKALKAMRAERSQRREKLGTSKLQIQEGQRSGNLITAMEDVSFGYGDHPVIDAFSTVVMRGDRIGVIGRNGAGKSTLLKLMLGELQPHQGHVKLGTNLQIAYFDQLREQLDENLSVQENVGDGYDMIQLPSGKKHVLGYLQDFLFTPERSRTKVKFLSGGERNRILLAKLFAKPANVIVLDEPTNDLDAETLELLEEKLSSFQGTVIVVSHDRAFLNNVVGSTIVFEEDGLFEYAGGYDDWIRQFSQKKKVAGKAAKDQSKPKKNRSNVDVNDNAPRKLKYKEKLELEKLPTTIEKLEQEIEAIHADMADPSFYQKPKTEIAESTNALKEKESALQVAYHRWEELEEIASASS